MSSPKLTASEPKDTECSITCDVQGSEEQNITSSTRVNHIDQVWSNIFLGDKEAAKNTALLQDLNITYILNAAEGDANNQLDRTTYDNLSIKYKGFMVLDDPRFNIRPYLEAGALFINEGLSSSGKILVFCPKGVSRAAVFVLAYLMLHQNMKLKDAVSSIIRHRSISPNSGFLNQLLDLEKELARQRTCQNASCREGTCTPECLSKRLT
ncbi:dual specificity phosphatase 13-like [Pelobates cultripes]|uniref:Dual specificity protein phosphatase n=1 Tax=Pelobates cultripes TaxID=61616 RepID=A0AAD1TBF5_PELCU|nr:dual specificity phosphatase 13-like [Pelobates cultripes]